MLTYFKPITTFVFDIDGVLTDGTLLLLENGMQARQMNIKDGLALQMALRNGYNVILVSGAVSAPVKDRLLYLGMQEIHQGVKDKLLFIQQYLQQQSIDWQHVLYMGDDLPDIGLLKKVGLSCCPADAVPEVKKVSRYISSVKGGKGCVRDVIERVLKLNNRWDFDKDITSR